MITTNTIYKLCLRSILALPLTGMLINSSPVLAQNQPPTIPDSSQTQPDLSDPNNPRSMIQDATLLSIEGGKKLMEEAKKAMANQDYQTAANKYQQARIVFNQLSNFYQLLASSFNGIDNRIVESQRKKALETALIRDEATYQLALVHRSQKQTELAIPLLVQVIRSQNPTRELGKKAYQQLFEMGFVEISDQKNTPSKEPNNTPSMTQESSLLSIKEGKRLMEEAKKAIANQDYNMAIKQYQQARIVCNQLSNFYQLLTSSFSGIDSRIVESLRKNTLETTLMRDEATYQLALVHRSQNQPELAVPLLVQIVRSQNSTRELGQKAYQQLFEIGFVEIPYQGRNTASSAPKK